MDDDESADDEDDDGLIDDDLSQIYDLIDFRSTINE